MAIGGQRTSRPPAAERHGHFNEAASRGQRIRYDAAGAWKPLTSMRPPAVASGYSTSLRHELETECVRLADGGCVVVSLVSTFEAASRGQRIHEAVNASAVENEAASRTFNEAASRGQRIRTNRKYPTRQLLRIVLRALPHHDHTRAARLSPARCGRCHHLSARTSSAVLDDRCKRFLLALVPLAAAVDELETVRRHPAGRPALRLEHLERLVEAGQRIRTDVVDRASREAHRP